MKAVVYGRIAFLGLIVAIALLSKPRDSNRYPAAVAKGGAIQRADSLARISQAEHDTADAQIQRLSAAEIRTLPDSTLGHSIQK